MTAEQLADWELALLGDLRAQDREDYWQQRADEVARELADVDADLAANLNAVTVTCPGHDRRTCLPCDWVGGKPAELRSKISDGGGGK